MSRNTGTADRPTRRPRRQSQVTGTAVLDRGSDAPGGVRGRAATTPRRTAQPTRGQSPVTRSVPRPHFSRLGSRQVVSVRGRRVSSARHSSRVARISAVGIALLIAGVALAMYFSGLSTQQTFRIQQLSGQETQLKNQIETLNRDLENVRSGTRLATRAGELGMVLPDQPGVLREAEDGAVTMDRPAGDTTSPILNVNSGANMTSKATSDPRRTKETRNQLTVVPPRTALLPGRQGNVPAPAAPAPAPTVGEQRNAPAAPAPVPEAVPAGPERAERAENLLPAPAAPAAPAAGEAAR